MMDLVKQDMIRNVSQMNNKNLKVSKELLLKQLYLLENICEIETYKDENKDSLNVHTQFSEDDNISVTSEQKINIHPDKSTQDQVIKQEPLSKEEHKPEPDPQTDSISYMFERKIRGGILPKLGAFVPEKVVRKLGLQHGDFVYAKEIEEEAEGSYNQGRKKYEYSLAQKGNGDELKGRIQYNYCPVIKENGYLVVERSAETDQYIRHDEVRYSVLLDEEDINHYHLTEGSLVDIAYPVDRPDLAKVIWNHALPHNNQESSTVEQLILGNTSKTNKKASSLSLDQTLKGQTILVIGNEPKKALYKENIEKRGGTFLWSDAKEKLSRLECLVRKADKVIFLLAVSGHTGMEHIKQYCKENEIPFETPWSKGVSTVVKIAES